MIFNTAWFCLFLPAALLLLAIVPAAVRRFATLLACLIFHYRYAGPAGMRTVLALGLGVYLLSNVRAPKRSLRTWLALGIAASAGVLIYCKYRAFLGSFWSGEPFALGPIPHLDALAKACQGRTDRFSTDSGRKRFGRSDRRPAPRARQSRSERTACENARLECSP